MGKTFLMVVGEMYITHRKADKEVELAKRHGETAKVKTAEVQATIQENNTLHRQKKRWLNGRRRWYLRKRACQRSRNSSSSTINIWACCEIRICL
ncbi:hypothetical protein L3X38_025143 [Prunus dulcis]|uniref:Uncharacterized protein n=1 Tax=Prunus dulcis TaxID=3755 RepID=A0AAD4W137_PRUDU|nr:hypothetical protein L3X38_025143 [Prunus dulcis]